MAVEQGPETKSFTAGEDLSSDQYKLVKFTAEESIVKASASTDTILGVLQNEPSSGEAASVATAGISKIVSGEDSISYNDWLIVDEGDNGKTISATEVVSSDSTTLADMTKLAGICVEGAGDGEVGSIDLNKANVVG